MQRGIRYSPFEQHAITLDELLEVAEIQQVEFRFGDILLIRTGWTHLHSDDNPLICKGWTHEYDKLSEKAKVNLSKREIRASCGVEASREAIKWHWDNRFAAVASDTVAYEVWPSPRTWGVAMHEVSGSESLSFYLAPNTSRSSSAVGGCRLVSVGIWKSSVRSVQSIASGHSF